MAAFLNICRFNPTAGSTTDWTYSSAVTGYNSPALAGVVNGTVYKYRAESSDLSQWEIGEGAYNTGTGVLARTTVLYNSSGTGTGAGQSGAGSKINFSAAPQVAVVAVKEDLLSIEEANSFTAAQSGQARVNLLAAGVVRYQKFTSSGTYTPHANLLYCVIECVGGGAGGGASAGSVGQIYGGGGGGSGGYSRLVASAATIGASKTVTIGAGGAGGTAGANNGAAGGDTSVTTICIGKGGSGGLYGSVSQVGGGGSGGVAGTGDLAGAGAAGGPGNYHSSAYQPALPAGFGGSSIFGGGAPAPAFSAGAATAGTAATGYGSGGSGAISSNIASNAAGGAGSAGIVFITEFCTK